MTVLHFVSGNVWTINACNYFGNLFANYYTAVYSVVTATNFTWYSSICRNTPTGIEYLSLSGLCAFQTLIPPPLKFHKYSPACSIATNHSADVDSDSVWCGSGARRRSECCRRRLSVARSTVLARVLAVVGTCRPVASFLVFLGRLPSASLLEILFTRFNVETLTRLLSIPVSQSSRVAFNE